MIPILFLASIFRLSICLFSVHDDILAFPQYDIRFPDGFVSVEDAELRLSKSNTPATEMNSEPTEAFEALWLESRRYLCSVPIVQRPPQLNATEKELSKAEEKKELARATSRGWELLSDLDGKCLYFISGWWSYSFCYNREVRQFHQVTSKKSKLWPPKPDPDGQQYILGQVSNSKGDTKKDNTDTELQATGELRYLVQKLGGGTICDITGKERKIEIQFHCNSHGTDRIDWIKEVSICSYLMVIHTPRLCNDVTFLPPRENRVNRVSCREIMDDKQQEEFYRMRAKKEQAKDLRVLQKAAKMALWPTASVEDTNQGTKPSLLDIEDEDMLLYTEEL